MIGPTDDRIALMIQTDADLTGVRNARAGVKALAGDVTTSTQQQIRQMGLLQIAAQKEDAIRTSSLVTLNKVPGSARTAANALGILSQAALTGNGSIAGMAAAAGGAATGLATLASSAKLAAAASGIGAVITVVGVAIAALIQMNKEATATAFTLERIGKIGSVVGGQAQLDLQNQRVTDLQAKAAAAAGRDLPGAVYLPGSDAHKAQQELEAALHVQRELSTRVLALEREAGREQAKVATDHAKEERDRAKANNEYVIGLSASAAAAQIALIEEPFARRRALLEHELTTERQALGERKLSDNDRLAALGEINRRREYSLQLIEREAAAAALGGQMDQQAKFIREGVNATATAEEKAATAKRRAISEGLAGYGKLSAAAKAHGGIVAAVSKAAADAVRLYEIGAAAHAAKVEGLKQLAAAKGALAIGNIPGAALHYAAAAGYGAAIAAAGVEAFGVVSGGGGGGGASGGGGDSTTFQPRSGEGGAGGQTFVFQMVNPASGEVLNETIYQLNRSGTLKRPITPGNFRGLLVASQVA